MHYSSTDISGSHWNNLGHKMVDSKNTTRCDAHHRWLSWLNCGGGESVSETCRWTEDSHTDEAFTEFPYYYYFYCIHKCLIYVYLLTKYLHVLTGSCMKYIASMMI